MNVLEEANKATQIERQRAYGNPAENMRRISEIASVIAGHEITDEDVVVVMIATKLARETHRHNRDNLVDLAGYAWMWGKLHGER